MLRLACSINQTLCVFIALASSSLGYADTIPTSRLQERLLAPWKGIYSKRFGASSPASLLTARRSLTASKANKAKKQPAPTMCKFEEVTDQLMPSCTPNNDYILSLAKTSIAKKGSPSAVQAVMGTFGMAECGKHNTSTPKGMDDCHNDKKNDCFLFPDPLNTGPECLSRLGMFKSACKGTLYQEVIECEAMNKKECQAATKQCTWSPLTGFGNAESVAFFAEMFSNQTGGKYEQEVGFCFHKEYVARGMANSTANQGQFDSESAEKWASSTYDSEDPDTFFKYRGTCDYAKKTLARNQYYKQCEAYNIYPESDTATWSHVAIRDDKPANVTNIMGCINSNCRFFQRDTPSFSSETGQVVVTSYIKCASSDEIMNAYTYDAKMDGPVYATFTKCYSQPAQHDKSICLGIM